MGKKRIIEDEEDKTLESEKEEGEISDSSDEDSKHDFVFSSVKENRLETENYNEFYDSNDDTYTQDDANRNEKPMMKGSQVFDYESSDTKTVKSYPGSNSLVVVSSDTDEDNHIRRTVKRVCL